MKFMEPRDYHPYKFQVLLNMLHTRAEIILLPPSLGAESIKLDAVFKAVHSKLL